MFRYINEYIYKRLYVNNFKTYIPIKPRDTECCGCGCYDCVWIQYYEKRKLYDTYFKPLSEH